MKKILLSLALIASGLFVTGCLKPEVSQEMQAKIETALATGKYVEYSATSEAAVKGKAPYVIFFHAPWCGTCVNWEQRIVSSISDLPENTKILKADYDTQAKNFGVNSQSTALFFDASGSQVNSILDPSVSVVKSFFDQAQKTAAPVLSIEEEAVDTDLDKVEETENSVESDESEKPAEAEKEAETVEVVAPIKELSVTVTENPTTETPETTDVVEEKSAALPAFQYIDYSADERAKYHGKQTYGVYFHADWCPTCVAYEKKIKTRKSEFPAGSVLIKADYDTARTLRQELGVVSQTTFVVLDATGKIVFKKVNPSFEDLTAQF